MGNSPQGSSAAMPTEFDAGRMNAAMRAYRDAQNSRNGGGLVRNRTFMAGHKPMDFNDFMNMYMQAAPTAPPPAVPRPPTAFQQFRATRQTGGGLPSATRNMQYTPPPGPVMARDNSLRAYQPPQV